MELELVSFKICPFGQRSVITLLHKQVPHTLTYITPMDLPEWFHDISPMGKVPLLKVNGRVLFESAVINEFIDESSTGSLLPEAPLEKAMARAWIEFASACLVDMHGLSTAATEEAFTTQCEALAKKLAYLERHMPVSEEFSLIDTAFGPLFLRLDFLNALHPFMAWDATPRVEAWAKRLLALPVMHDSLPADFPQLYRGFLGRQGEYGAKLFGA